MVTAGVAASLSECVTVDLAWRYTDHGSVHIGWGEDRVIWRDGNCGSRPLGLAATRARLAGYGLRQVPGRLFRRREGSGSPGSRTPSTGLAGCRHGTGGLFPKPFLKVVPRIH